MFLNFRADRAETFLVFKSAPARSALIVLSSICAMSVSSWIGILKTTGTRSIEKMLLWDRVLAKEGLTFCIGRGLPHLNEIPEADKSKVEYLDTDSCAVIVLRTFHFNFLC